jgi:gas vesicle protein
MTRGVGIAKKGFGRALSRTGYSAGGEVMEDMSSIHEEAESPKEEAKETKLEKKGYKETKTGKMIKDVGRGIKEGVKKVAKAPFDAAETVVESFKKLKDPEFRKKAGIGEPYKGPSRKEFRKGGTVKKDTHITKDGRVAKKGLYYYMNRAKKLGKSRPGKGTVSDKALKASAKTAKK